MLQVEKLNLYRLNIPFKQNFTHNLYERKFSESVVLELQTNFGVFYGECLPREYVSGESPESTCDALANTIFPVLPLTIATAREIHQLIDKILLSFPDALCACAALELALLQALCSAKDSSLYALLNIKPLKESLSYSAVIPCLSETRFESIVALLRAHPPPNLKLKISKDLDQTARQLEILRKNWPNTSLRVDANGAWENLDVATICELVNTFSIAAIEQPVICKSKAEEVEVCLNIKKKCRAALIADESLKSIEDLDHIVKHQHFDVLNIKLSKTGGIGKALAIYLHAKAHGLKCQLGANVGETSILTQAGAFFASVSGDLLYHEGAYGTLLLEEDICSPSIMFDSHWQLGIKDLKNAHGLLNNIQATALLDKFGVALLN